MIPHSVGPSLANLPPERRMIAYIRVSTQKQGRSGLGLEAQQQLVQQRARELGATIVASYQEVETGKKSDKARPQLALALAHARRCRGTLVIAKLDRLARNVRFLLELKAGRVPLLFCDLPEVAGATGELIVCIMAAVAEWEARTTSERTKAALAAYLDKGGKLGNPANLTPEHQRRGRELARELHRTNAVTEYAEFLPLMRQLRAEGKSYREIAGVLNHEGCLTRRKKPWNPGQVLRVLRRCTWPGT